MSKDFPNQLEELYSVILNKIDKYKLLNEKDIRLKHLQILSSEILFGLYSFTINTYLAENLPNEFEEIFQNNTKEIEHYAYWHNHNITSNLFSTFIFQSELLFRVYYSKLNGGEKTPGGEKNIHRIFSYLLDDVENNEQKDETKLLILLWKLRNTIHTSGIYLDKSEGFRISYKDMVYKFEYGKSPAFLKDGFIIDLLKDFINVLETIYDKTKIIELGFVEHSSYLALDK